MTEETLEEAKRVHTKLVERSRLASLRGDPSFPTLQLAIKVLQRIICEHLKIDDPLRAVVIVAAVLVSLPAIANDGPSFGGEWREAFYRWNGDRLSLRVVRRLCVTADVGHPTRGSWFGLDFPNWGGRWRVIHGAITLAGETPYITTVGTGKIDFPQPVGNYTHFIPLGQNDLLNHIGNVTVVHRSSVCGPYDEQGHTFPEGADPSLVYH